MKKGIILILVLLVALSATVFATAINGETLSGVTLTSNVASTPIYGSWNFTGTTTAGANVSNCSFFYRSGTSGAWTYMGSSVNTTTHGSTWTINSTTGIGANYDTTGITTGESNTYQLNFTCYANRSGINYDVGNDYVLTNVYIDNQVPTVTYKRTPLGNIECTNGKLFLDATGSFDLTQQTPTWTISGAESYAKTGNNVQLYGKDIDRCGQKYNVNVSLQDYAGHTTSNVFSFTAESTSGERAVITEQIVQEQQSNKNKIIIEIVIGIVCLVVVAFVLWLVFKKD